MFVNFDPYIFGSGALTSKPYAFISRPWELEVFDGIDIFDSFLSSLNYYIRDLTILRVLPVVGSRLDNNWISDKARFSYDGFYQQRLTTCYLRFSTKDLVPVEWQLASKIFILHLLVCNNFYTILGRFCSYQDQLSVRDFSNLYFGNAFSNVFTEFSSVEQDLEYFYLLDSRVLTLKDGFEFENLIFLSCNLRFESPVLNLHVRRLVYSNPAIKMFSIGSYNNLFYNTRILNLGSKIEDLLFVFSGNSLSSNFFVDKSTLVLFGSSFLDNYFLSCNFNKFTISLILNLLKSRTTFNFISYYFPASYINSLDLGLNFSLNNFFDTNNKCFLTSTKNNVWYFIDSDEYAINRNSFHCSNFFDNNYFVYQGHHGDKLVHYSDLILPLPLPHESLDQGFLSVLGEFKMINNIPLPISLINTSDYLKRFSYLFFFLPVVKYLIDNFFNYFVAWFRSIKNLFLFNDDLNYVISRRFHTLCFKSRLVNVFVVKFNNYLVCDSFFFEFTNLNILGNYLSNYYQTDSISRSSTVMALANYRYEKEEYLNFFN